MVRGRSGGHPQLMYWAEVALLRWLFERRGVARVSLRVLTSNWIPISIHSAIGFRIVKTEPLVRKEAAGEIHLVTGETGGEALRARLVTMQLTAVEYAHFLQNHDQARA